MATWLSMLIDYMICTKENGKMDKKEREWLEYVKKMQHKLETGEIKDLPWDDFVKYYINYDQGVSWEYVWNYRGVNYGLYPLERFGRYEFLNIDTKESIIYKDIFEALDKIRQDGKTIKELYESNLIFIDIDI